ncbi:MAG: NUMOD3 domain-containing DNA-binding protein [Bacilli bacterium]|nr:NUMOD3 domain-containing DNA-binding protein [Bacilli bacterium]
MISYIIYKITAPFGKLYIGQTCDFIRRDYEHGRRLNNTPLSRAIQKYGYNNFTSEIIEEGLTIDEANEREAYWIDFYNTLAPNGYNLHSGGLNHIVSEETRKRMSDSRLGEKNPNFGKHWSNEILDKISKNHADVSGENNPMYGKVNSEEVLKKHSERMTGENNPASKKYIITFPDNHEEIILCLAKFCRQYNLTPQTMSSRGKHKGFKCRYYTEEFKV